MAKVEPLEHVPVFVGSTFEDLQPYRNAVRDALHKLETIVRGMEYFGSKPGHPVEECLATVRSCRVYVGIFAMRYGSIPDGYNHSMTHLEYNEAQEQDLPCLIYLIHTDKQAVLPRHVETGEGAEKLEKLKSLLCGRHTVSFFTTPDDLAAKILHDLPPVLNGIGATIEDKLKETNTSDTAELIQYFSDLSLRNTGQDLPEEFSRAKRRFRMVWITEGKSDGPNFQDMQVAARELRADITRLSGEIDESVRSGSEIILQLQDVLAKCKEIDDFMRYFGDGDDFQALVLLGDGIVTQLEHVIALLLGS